MIKVKEGTFRKDKDRLFEMTDTLTCSKLNHTPFIVLDEIGGVTICNNAEDLVKNFRLDTPVLKQWTGNYKSDFILMDVFDVKIALDELKKRTA